jgi:VCBS repeat protein
MVRWLQPSSVSKLLFCIGLMFFAALSSVSAQPYAPRPLPSEPLEKYGDPPAYVWRTELAPRMISQLENFTSYQVNVSAGGLNIYGDAANEPSICVDPTNPSKMAIGWRQFDSVMSNFRQAGYGYTSDGGRTWTFPRVLQANVFRSDPVLNSDSGGAFFYLSLLENFYDDMWRSLNGGALWSRLAAATGGDKQWFTIDTSNSSGHGFQYQTWSTAGNNYGGRQFSRSTNGGVTWMDPINIPHAPVWGTLDVDSNGLLFIGAVDSNGGQVWCIRSSNARNPSVVPTFDQAVAVNLGGFVISGRAINPEGIIGQVYVAADRSGTATNNNIYMLASVEPTGFTTGTDVMLVRSTDGGRTFSAPRRLNDDPVNHNKWHWMGTLSVAPNGRIDVVWLDTRNAANNTDSQLFYTYSFDGGATWARNVAVSNSFNPLIGYPNQNKMGDYISIVSDNGGGNVAYTATFNGEEDVYYVRVVPPELSQPRADFNFDRKSDLVWQNDSTGQRAVWLMNGTTRTGSAYLNSTSRDWNIVGSADFNHDGSSDIVWQNSVTGQRAIWLMNGLNFRNSVILGSVATSWNIAGAGDFNSDGKPDILWQSTSGERAVWLMNGTVRTSIVSLRSASSDWEIAASSDFNGDGKPDLVWQNKANGQRALWLMNGTTFAGSVNLGTVALAWKIAGAGDFNGDGKADIIWQNTSTGQNSVWLMNGSARSGSANLPSAATQWSIRNR